MRSSYKKLGQFIREVSVKNKDLSVELLLGVSITKKFIPSIANTVGTDMSKYKIVKHHQFAYGPVTSRNGEKISVALLDEEECLVSTSYSVFEVIDKEKLEPEYLMMWFRRSEFDRYARFMSHGTVRELFGWQEMCDVELPVPNIEKQREIVREYNVVSRRMVLNEKLTQMLEDISQAIYKQWFVDFEFPISKEYAESIVKPELEGMPYKSSGGAMVYCEELDIDIPKNWNVLAMDHVSDVIDSMHKTPTYSASGKSMVRVTDVDGSYLELTNTLKVDDDVFDEFTSKYSPQAGDIVLTRVGTYGVCSYVGTVEPFCLGQNTVVINPQRITGALLFSMLKSSFIKEQIEEGVTGSTQKTISLKLIRQLKLILPSRSNLLLQVQKPFIPIVKNGQLITEENSKLRLMKEILLSKLSKG